jgi:hypothetical protein
LYCSPWPGWSNALVVVKPETVVGWHRAGFRLFWRIRSRSKNIGKLKIDARIRVILDHVIVPGNAHLRGVLAGQTGGRQSQCTLDAMRAGVKIPGATPCEPYSELGNLNSSRFRLKFQFQSMTSFSSSDDSNILSILLLLDSIIAT